MFLIETPPLYFNFKTLLLHAMKNNDIVIVLLHF